MVTKYRWVAPTPRAHATNQSTSKIVRDLDVEDEAKAQAMLAPFLNLHQNLVGDGHDPSC